jgi:hypothetical protein
MAKQTMTLREAEQQAGEACSQVEEILLGLYGTQYPEPNEDALMDLLSEAKDKLDDAQNILQSRAESEQRAAKTPAQKRHEEGCWAGPNGPLPPRKKAAKASK